MTRMRLTITFDLDDDADIETPEFSEMVAAAFVQVEDADGVTTRNVEVHVDELADDEAARR